jgi:hypothetical protein
MPKSMPSSHFGRGLQVHRLQGLIVKFAARWQVVLLLEARHSSLGHRTPDSIEPGGIHAVALQLALHLSYQVVVHFILLDVSRAGHGGWGGCWGWGWGWGWRRRCLLVAAKHAAAGQRREGTERHNHGEVANLIHVLCLLSFDHQAEPACPQAGGPRARIWSRFRKG